MAYKIEVQEHCVVSDFFCGFCGQIYSQQFVAVVLNKDGKEALSDICPDCLEATPQGAAERMRQNAERYRKYADNLDALAEGIETISGKDWQATVEHFRRKEREAESFREQWGRDHAEIANFIPENFVDVPGEEIAF